MVNTCKSALRIVMLSKLKWLTSLDQKVAGAGVGADGRRLVVCMLPGLCAGTYGRVTPEAETRKPRIFASTGKNPIFPPPRSWVQSPTWGQGRSGLLEPTVGKQIVSDAQEGAGAGSWSKRMPSCNGTDTGSGFARRESEQTSRRCLVAKKCLKTISNRESRRRRRLRSHVCAPSPSVRRSLMALHEYRGVRWTANSVRVDESWLSRGLSRVRGNFHARFLARK